MAPIVAAATLAGGIGSVGRAPLSPAGNLSGYGEVVVTSSDPRLVPNDGLRSNLTGFTTEPFPALSKFQLGVEETIGPYLVTFGLFQNTEEGPYPFFSVFNNTTAATVFASNESGFPAVLGGAYDFTLLVANGTNWTLTLNGALFGGSFATSTFDFGVRSAAVPGSLGLSEIAYAAGPVVPRLTEIPTAFAVADGGGWLLPSTATTSYRGDPTLRWGIDGRTENASLVPGMLETGTSIASPPNGTTIWSGPLVPLTFSLQIDPSQVPGFATALVSGTVENESGDPLAGFPLVLSDSAGVTFSAPFPSADRNGSIRLALTAPNVSGVTPDPVRLTSRAMGAAGFAEQVIEIDPPPQVLLHLEGPSRLGPGGSAGFLLSATLSGGESAPGLAITLYAVGGGTIEPTAGITDANGEISLQLVAPKLPGTVRLFATVTTAGFWGEATFFVAVQAPPPPLWTYAVPYILPGLLIALGVVGVVWWVRRLPPRRDMAELGLRRPPPGPPSGTAEEVSRTPPSASSP